MKIMDAKWLGGVLLVAGTSIGGGMLALPVAAAPAGFLTPALFFIFCWYCSDKTIDIRHILLLKILYRLKFT